MKKMGYAGLYGLFLVVGLLMLHDINTKGYYWDGKHGFRFYGNEARLTAHLVIVFSVIGIVYVLFSKDRSKIKTTATADRSNCVSDNENHKGPPNQAL